MSELRDVFGALLDSQKKEESSVLCTVFTARGSVPRRSGSRMLVREDGTFAGTVGGGLGEALSLEHAARLLKEEGAPSDLRAFELGKDKPGSIGICGGNFQVLFQVIRPGNAYMEALAEAVLGYEEENRRTWLITVRRDGRTAVTLYVDEEGMLEGIAREGEVTPLLKWTAQFSPDEDIYAEPLTDGSTVYIFGGGHVSRETVRELAQVDFSVVVYENRPEFAAPERFPAAAGTVLAPYEEIREHVAPGPLDYAIVMTRGDGDETCLRELLQTKAGHIGCIGSRGKLAVIRQRLAESGFSQEDIARIRNPIGLPIESETPAEIAVSVAAEMILLRAQRKKA